MNSAALLLFAAACRGTAAVLLLLLAERLGGRYMTGFRGRRLWLLAALLFLLPQPFSRALPIRVDLSGIRAALPPAATGGSAAAAMLLLSAGGLALLGRRYYQCRKRLRNLPPVTDARILEAWRNILLHHGKLRRAPVLLDGGPAEVGPTLFGCFQRRLLLPEKQLATLSEKELELILLHEYFHVRAGDLFINVLGLLPVGLFWYNPLVFVLRRRLRAACEMTCDRRVLASSPGSEREYGRLLLRFAAEGSGAVAFAEVPRELRRRINRLVNPPVFSRQTRLLGLLLPLVLAALLLVGVAVKPKRTSTAKNPSKTTSRR